MKISIKREQNQAGLSFAERKKFRPKVKKNKLLLLLALLMTAATGAWAQAGMTKGLFSVSATKRVHFSKGNLQYDGTNWKFAASQWEVLGANGTGANGTANNYPMDLFTWGNIDSPTYNGTTYYTENADLSGITDWGSRMGFGWRTLSSAEWTYLFNTRTVNGGTGSGKSYTLGQKVNNKPGVVIYPDNYTGELYSGSDWATFESAGCVFLPIAGLRNVGGAGKITNVGTRGCYWSRTNNNDNHAYYVNFNTGEVSPQIASNRVYGLSVRLVIDEYVLTLADGTQDAKNWTITSGEKSATGDVADGLKGISEKDAVTLTYGGRLKVKSVTATTDAAPAEEPVTLATPLTIEAITPGTIVVNMTDELETGMKYSVNGGTPKLITTTTPIEDLKAGDKVQFYGNGTDTQAYGDVPEVSILGDGDGFKTKVYGNIMSLLDETGFATKTDLPDASFVFYGLFKNNATLIDASELLLPAATLQESCYQAMFQDCTSLTKAPKLTATTLTTWCYLNMFNNCKKLATVTCLATSGINEDNSTSNWLQGAGSEAEGTKTFNAVSTAEWPSGANGIPTGWTRVNIDN